MDVEKTAGNRRKRTPEADAFAAQLRAERAAAGLTQNDLSKRSGIGVQTIFRIENGDRVMDTSQLGALVKALDISIATFAARAEERLQAERHASRAAQ